MLPEIIDNDFFHRKATFAQNNFVFLQYAFLSDMTDLEVDFYSTLLNVLII